MWLSYNIVKDRERDSYKTSLRYGFEDMISLALFTRSVVLYYVLLKSLQ